MSTYDRADKPQARRNRRQRHRRRASDQWRLRQPVQGAEALRNVPISIPRDWQPKPSRHIVTLQTATSDDETDDQGTVYVREISNRPLRPRYEHLP